MRWSDMIGKQVGQYEVLKELGHGGAARVFSARDGAQARMVAFKVLPIETDDRVSFMQRFKREVDAIRLLRHPNIVQVYDSGEEEEFVYLVLRLLGGGTLRERIAAQRMSAQEVCQYMIQIALALHHAHQQGIIHRDVKPSNMLLDDEQPGRILLTDFGTAKIQNAAGLTKTGATVGTPEYMSPEQAEGREVDQRSDIYSLGCALYEALAGRPPFIGATPVSVLYQQVHAQPTYIRSYNAEAPRELWDVLRTCLAKRPDDRYGTAEYLAEKLQPFAEGLIQPTPAPWPPQAPGLANPTTRPLRGSLSVPLSNPPVVLPSPELPDMRSVNGLSRANGGAGPIPLYLEGTRAPTSRPSLAPRGPRPTVRLPSTTGGPGLLSASGPLTPEAQQAVAAYHAQLEADERQAAQAPVAPPLPQPSDAIVDLLPTAPLVDPYPTEPAPVAPQRAPTSGPYRGPVSGPYRSATSGPMSGQPRRAPTSAPMYRGPTSGPMVAPQRAPTSGPYRGPASGPYRSATSGPVRRTTSIPLDMASLRSDINPKTLGRRRSQRRSPLVATIVVAAVIALSVALGIGGVKLFARQAVTPRATPRPTMTLAPTATVTQPTVTATATLTAQQALDRQAASAFRAITIGSFTDGSCSSADMKTQFSGGPVYVNLCMAASKAPGPVTVVVRSDGATVRTLMSNLRTNAGATYSQGHTLSPGSYDMLVTMQIGGKQAVAKDIAFTVN